VLWLFEQVTGQVGEERMVYYPGAASNPEPLELIRSHPVLALDIAFYMLARVDAALPEPTGFHRNFRTFLVNGPILSTEISAAVIDTHKAIAEHSPEDFVARLRRYASVTQMTSSPEAMEPVARLSDPVRGTIPLALIDMDCQDDTRLAAEDYLLSFAMCAALARAFEAIDSIVTQGLSDESVAAIHPLLRRMAGDVTRPRNDREGAANAVWLVRDDLTARPEEFWWTTFFMVSQVNGSRLQTRSLAPLVEWVFSGTRHLIGNARFNLASPMSTVPPVEEIVSGTERTLGSAARLLLALAPAVSASFSSAVHDRLNQIAGLISKPPRPN
jgi:hypothetical protein